MNLFYHEFIKLIKRKSFWGLLICILFVNLVFVNIEKSAKDQSGYNQLYYEEVFSTLEGMSLEDASRWLEKESLFYTSIEDYKMSLLFPDTFESLTLSKESLNRYKKHEDDTHYWVERSSVVNELSSYYQKLIKYPSYLNSIKKNLNTVKNNPMWNKMDASEKDDIIYQSQSYDKLAGNELIPVRYRSIQSFANSLSLKLLSLVLICLYAILIMKEDEEKMQELLSSTLYGHKTTAIVKVGVFIIVSIFSILLLQGCDLLWRCFIFGGYNGTAPIQCIPLFYESSLSININEWLFISMMQYTGMILMLGLFFMFCYHFFKNKILSFMLFFGIFFAEAILYSVISPQSKWVFLSHMNLIRIFEGSFVGTFLSYYHILSLRVSAQSLMIILCVLLGIVSMFLYIHYFDDMWKGKQYSIPSFSIKSTNLLMQEGFRILYINKGLFIVFITILLCISNFMYRYNTYKDIRQEQKNIYQIYEKYEGEINEDTKFYLNLKMETYANAEQKYQEGKEAYQKKEITYDDLMEEQITYTMRMKDKSIYEKLYSFLDMPYQYIIYNEGFSAIFSLKMLDKDNATCIFTIASLLLFICAISYKKEEEELYLTTYKGGNKRKQTMWFHILFFPILMICFIEICDFLHFYNIYPMKDFNVSMDQLLMLDGNLPISHLSSFNAGQYMGLLYSVKLFGIFSICMIATCIFRYSKNRIISLLIGFSIFFIPMFLYYNGFTFMSIISVFDVVMGNLFLQKTFSIMKLIFLLLIDITCILFIKKSYVKI